MNKKSKPILDLDDKELRIHLEKAFIRNNVKGFKSYLDNFSYIYEKPYQQSYGIWCYGTHINFHNIITTVPRYEKEVRTYIKKRMLLLEKGLRLEYYSTYNRICDEMFEITQDYI